MALRRPGTKIATATSCLLVLDIPISVLRDCDLLEELRLDIHLPQRTPDKKLPSAQFEKDLADTFRGSKTAPPVKSLEINIHCHTKANCLPNMPIFCYPHGKMSATFTQPVIKIMTQLNFPSKRTQL
jgi:hypothetical protein